jgi:hypothetical protein
MRRYLAILAFAFALGAQEKPVWVDPMTLTKPEAILAFQRNFRRATMSGEVVVPENGLALVVFVDFANLPKGFARKPGCSLTEHSEPAKIKRWVVTDRTDFFSFKATPGQVIAWSCTGWAYR